MPKRPRRRTRAGASTPKKKSRGRTVAPTAGDAARGGAPPEAAPFSHPIVRAPQPVPSRAPTRDYAYVVKEVQRIALLAAGIFILMIVLSVILV
jgi:hypothetical protein